MNRRAEISGSVIFKVGLMLAALVMLPLALAQASTESIPRADQGSNISLEARYVSEVLKFEIQRAEQSGMSVVAEGLKYASSKLCKIETSGELDILNLASKKTIQSLDGKISKNKSLLQETFHHLLQSRRLVITDSAMSNIHRESAEAGLDRLSKQSLQIDRSLAELQKNLVKTEVVYQRVLAECLLDDFKSIFGAGGIPLPLPKSADDNDKWPDELWDESDPPPSDYLEID